MKEDINLMYKEFKDLEEVEMSFVESLRYFVNDKTADEYIKGKENKEYYVRVISECLRGEGFFH